MGGGGGVTVMQTQLAIDGWPSLLVHVLHTYKKWLLYTPGVGALSWLHYGCLMPWQEA